MEQHNKLGLDLTLTLALKILSVPSSQTSVCANAINLWYIHVLTWVGIYGVSIRLKVNDTAFSMKVHKS